MIRKLLMALLVSLVLAGAALAAPELELWDGNMTARPLQLGEYEKLYVYTGPGADYKKAENGISKVKGLIETYGNENGFTLVLYPRDVKALSHYYNIRSGADESCRMPFVRAPLTLGVSLP